MACKQNDVIANSTFDEELQGELLILSNEFQSLGLSGFADLQPYRRLMLMQLIDNGHSLIQMYRKLIEKNNNGDLKLINSNKEVVALNKLVDSTKFDLSLCSSQVSALKQEMKMKEVELDTVRKENEKLKVEKQFSKQLLEGKENASRHKVNKLENENYRLQEKLALGPNKSKDLYVSELLGKYKVKEEIYKETILQLENNNKALFKELLCLREMIVSEIGKDD